MQEYITRELKYELNPDELLIYSRQLAKNQQDKNEADSGKKSVVADYNDKIARFNSEIQILSRKVANGYEHRPIKCQWKYNWQEGEKTLVRLDTNQIVEVVEITPEERQQELHMPFRDNLSTAFDDKRAV